VSWENASGRSGLLDLLLTPGCYSRRFGKRLQAAFGDMIAFCSMTSLAPKRCFIFKIDLWITLRRAGSAYRSRNDRR
jgi:hypothetical protein